MITLVVAFVLGALAIVWVIVRALLTFLTGMSFLASVVGFGGWALTGNPALWAMGWKSALACLVVGLLLSGALLPLLTSEPSRPTGDDGVNVPFNE